jgi:hypothetical protein
MLAPDNRAVVESASQPQPGTDPPAAATADLPDAPATAAAPTVAPEPDPCSDALAWVAAAGLPLPAGVGYHCPSTQFPHQGAACWDDGPCVGTAFVVINMDRLAGTSTAYLHHVVAHEVCHILDFQATGTSTEWGADACAAAHGAPTPA